MTTRTKKQMTNEQAARIRAMLGITRLLPREFGNGWMTTNASDLAKIIFAMAMVTKEQQDQFVAGLVTAKGHGERINMRTVERVAATVRDRFA